MQVGALFDEVDETNTGYLQLDECRIFLRVTGVPEPQIEERLYVPVHTFCSPPCPPPFLSFGAVENAHTLLSALPTACFLSLCHSLIGSNVEH